MIFELSFMVIVPIDLFGCNIQLIQIVATMNLDFCDVILSADIFII